MPKIISQSELRNIIRKNEWIKDGVEKDAEGIKYDFRFGERFLKSYFSVPKNYSDLRTPDELQNACVEPGEVVFVMSQEQLFLPENVYIQLSPKRSLSHDGIELLGGLTIDPGYCGFLVFGLYNVSGTPFKLKPGIKLVGANLCQLAEDELPQDSLQRPNPIFDFPERLQDLIGKYKPVNPQTISEELQKLQRAFNDSQQMINDSLSVMKTSIGDIKNGLVDEERKRERETDRMNGQLNALEKKIENINDNSIRQSETLRSLKDTLKETKEDLKSDIKDLKLDFAKIDNMFISIKTWAKILAGIIGIAGAIIAGLSTGVIQSWIV